MTQTDKSSLELQKQKWQEMRESLSEFCRLLEGNMTDFKQKFNQNWQMGFPSEKAYFYEQTYLLEVEKEIEQLTQNIQKEHFDFIDERIAKIDKLLAIT